MKKRNLWLLISVFAISFPSLSQTSPSNSETQQNRSTETESLTKTGTEPLTTITFTQSSVQLNQEETQKLRSLIESAKAEGPIKEIKVAVWSDQETPLKPQESLSKEERKIAEERGEAIKKYLHDDLQVKDIKIYNMAHGTSKLAELFKTEESELRTAFAKKGAEGKIPSEVKLILNHGKPSTAVVVVEHKK